MRLLFACLVLWLIAVVGFSVAHAEMKEKGSHEDFEVYAGILFGGVAPEDLEIADREAPIVDFVDLDLDEGLIVGCKVGCLIGGVLRKAAALELEYSHITNTDVGTQHGFSADGRNVDVSGELPINSLFLNFVLRHPSGDLHPYVGIGPGWSWFKFRRISQSADVSGFVPVSEQANASDDTFAIQGVAGIEIDLAETVSLDLGYRYYHVEAELDNPKVDLEYRCHAASVGFNYSF